VLGYEWLVLTWCHLKPVIVSGNASYAYMNTQANKLKWAVTEALTFMKFEKKFLIIIDLLYAPPFSYYTDLWFLSFRFKNCICNYDIVCNFSKLCQILFYTPTIVMNNVLFEFDRHCTFMIFCYCACTGIFFLTWIRIIWWITGIDSNIFCSQKNIFKLMSVRFFRRT